MKSLYFSVIISVFNFLSCSREEYLILPVEAVDLFPLQVGNKWTYLSSLDSSEWSYEITSTKVINGNVYFEFIRTYSNNARDTNYFRVTGSMVLILYEGNDYTFIDFEKPLNEVWASYENFYGYIRQRNINDNVEAGSFTGITEVFLDNTSISDVYEFNRYAPDVGLISSSRFRFKITLLRARVNGLSFP